MHSILLTEQTETNRTTLSLNALQQIIDAENKSGRTILIWIGHAGQYSKIRTICSLSGITGRGSKGRYDIR
jgi:hypothetical protein